MIPDPYTLEAKRTIWGAQFKVEGQLTLPLFEGAERNPEFMRYMEWLRRQKLDWEPVYITKWNFLHSLLGAPGFHCPNIDNFIVLAIQRERQNG